MSSTSQLASFSIIDYVVFAVMLMISMGIGVFFAFKGNKNTEDFLMGGRQMSVLPVAISLLSSFISAISILGYSGETYANGMQLSMMLLGAFVGIFMAAKLFLPVFYPLKLTSVNEYIELRFKSRGMRLTVLAVSTFICFFYTGLCLYAPTLALSSVTPISVDTYIILLGIVCTIYSAVGGLKAVVWTDTFQMAVILMGVVSVIVVGCLEVGGINNVWAIASQYGRTQLFDLSINPYERHNLLNVLIMGSTIYFAMYGANQTNLQRACSVSSIKDAQRVYYINLVGMILSVGMVFFSGLCAFASYAGCDPLTQGHIFTKDQILPYFVMDKMGFLYGMPGLFVATLLGGALSSMSSVINSMVAMLWTDLFMKFSFFQNLSKAGAAVANKAVSFLIGGVMIGLAFLAKGFGGLFQVAMTFMGIMGGPTMGIFTMGLLLPQVGKKGAWTGLVVSTACMTWLSVGATYYNPKPTNLPFSIANCTVNLADQPLNSTFSEDIEVSVTTAIYTKAKDFESALENRLLKDPEAGKPLFQDVEKIEDLEASVVTTTLTAPEKVKDDTKSSVQDWPMMYLYGISYTLYTPFGSLLCITIAIIVTLITGGEDLAQVRPDLIAPVSRRFLPKPQKGAKEYSATYTMVNPYYMQDLKIPPPDMLSQPDP